MAARREVPARRHDGADRPVVLQSFAEPGPQTNPHVVLLLRALRRDLDVRTFTWRRALLDRYDVLHLHWPEVLVSKSTRLRSLASVLALAAVLARCRLRRTAVVRTAHNVAPHERQPALARAVLRWCDRSTTWWIRLNDTTPTPPGVPATTIPLGDYGDWYAAHPAPPQTPGRLLYFGLVRPYKGVLELVRAFRADERGDLSLRVVGRPANADTAREVDDATGGDPRIGVALRHIDDAELVAEVGAAELVVLPYRAMHNSGALLLALTLRRPVLVPANPVTDALAAEVGERWVQRFDGELAADDLERALAAVRATTGDGPPDLRGRSWDALADRHVALYVDAVRAATGRRAAPAG